jgi:hypothetical protein
MAKLSDICEGFNNLVDESEEIRTTLCADIVFSSKYIKHCTFPQSKTFNNEIMKIFNILNQYYKPNSKVKGKSTHPYLKNKEAYKELVELSSKTDAMSLSILLSKIPKYRNILTLFELYSILRIVNEFSIEYSQYIKTSYFEERLKLYEKS